MSLPPATPTSAGRRRRALLLAVLVAILGALLVANRPPDYAAMLRTPQDDVGHTFLAIGPDGAPASWDRCAGPVPWVVEATTPAADVAGLVRLFDTLIDGDGAPRFVFAGTTTRNARAELLGDASSGPGPVVVGFGAPPPPAVGPPGRAEDRLALGAPALLLRDGRLRIVGGRVVIDPGGWARANAVLRATIVTHEALHVLGLGHTDVPGNVMAPRANVATLGDGDRDGVRALDAIPCG